MVGVQEKKRHRARKTWGSDPGGGEAASAQPSSPGRSRAAPKGEETETDLPANSKASARVWLRLWGEIPDGALKTKRTKKRGHY